MTKEKSLFTLRFAAAVATLVIPLLGCVCGDESLHEEPIAPTSTSVVCDSEWTPERIELLDMSDRALVDEAGTLRISFGGQGSEMVGFYIAVYGDDIPDCMETAVELEGFSGEVSDWQFAADGPRRAETPAPVYWVMDGAGAGASTLTVTIGDLTTRHDVTIDY